MSPDARRLASEVADEVVAVACKVGLMVDGAKVHALIDLALDHHRDHRPSMLQDMLAGRRTEIASINGAVARIAEQVNQPAPRTAALYAL